MKIRLTQSLTDILADLILAESSVLIIESGAKVKTRDPDYLSRRALGKYAKRALPAIAEAIEFLSQLKQEKESADGDETRDKTDEILRDDTKT